MVCRVGLARTRRDGGRVVSAADRLGVIEARANAASVGPWAHAGGDGRVYRPSTDMTIALTGEVHGAIEDAAFIAAVRTDVPALVAALRAVLEVTDAAGMSPGSIRAYFADDIVAALTAALDGAS